MRVRFSLENVGRSPAIQAWARLSFLADEYPDHIDLIAYQRKMCNRLESPPKSPLFSEDTPMPSTVFPGEHIEVDQHVYIYPKDIDRTLTFIGQANGPTVMVPVLLECFEYHSGFSDQHYQTGVIYRLFRRPPDSPLKHFAIDPIHNRITPGSQLSLEEIPGGHYAY
jgi:hypothetical protein